MSIAVDSTELKIFIFLQPIIQKLLQLMIDPAEEILPYVKTA